MLSLPAATSAAPDTDSAGDDWLPLRERDLRVRSGSALDFSALTPARDGVQKPLRAGPEGHLVQAGGQAGAERHLCASLQYTAAQGLFPDHAEADALALELRRRGYSLARLHFVDAGLMHGREADFDYDPEQLDRFQYLLAALKKQGIRWILDAMTSWNGALGDAGPERFARVHELREALYLDEAARTHWKGMVDSLLAVQNPYTGLSPLQDPALAVVNLVNEGGLRFLSRQGLSPRLEADYRAWLARHHPGHESEALPGLWAGGPRAARLNEYFLEKERDSVDWMHAHLRERGYAGLISAFANGRSLQAMAVRGSLPAVSNHAYFDHPTDFTRPGSTQRAASALDESLPLVRRLAVNRVEGKPMLVQEYDHPYWSPWRHETGLAVPAYAAFQDWDVLCRFNNPAVLHFEPDGVQRRRAIHPFSVGMDPVARAGEVLAALLFKRGDVRPGQHEVLLGLDPALAIQAGGNTLLEDTHGAYGLLARTAVHWGPAPPAAPGRTVLAVDDAALNGSIARLRRLLGGGPALDGTMLREAGLPPGEPGSLRSDTGELVLRPSRGELEVRTPRTEALVYRGGAPLSLPHLRVLESSAPVLVALSALGQDGLDSAGRLLLTVVTDALNTGARFGPGRRELIELGSLPVRLRRLRLRLGLRGLGPAEDWVLYPLALNGARREALRLRPDGGQGMALELDTGRLSGGPSVFFELVRRDAPP